MCIIVGGRKEYGGVGGAPGIFDAPNNTTAAASSSPHPFSPGIIIIFSSPPFPGGESAGCRRWNARYFREEVKGWAPSWCCDVSQQDIGFPPLFLFHTLGQRILFPLLLFFFREIALGRSVRSFDKSAFGRHFPQFRVSAFCFRPLSVRMPMQLFSLPFPSNTNVQ